MKILKEVSKQNGTIFTKIKKLKDLKEYRTKIIRGVKNGSIYHDIKEQDPEINSLVRDLSNEDIKLCNDIFKDDIKKFLKKTT